MTLAERPYPFPSRTRKSSSPAPKILRGQPFGKIGRRRDLCVSGRNHSGRRRRLSGLSFRFDEHFAGSMTASSATVPTPPAHAAELTAAVCPYLLAADGGWRASTAVREHRCTAVMPATPIAAEKQARLCLTAAHRSCATFLAATGVSETSGSSTGRLAPLDHSGARAIVRTTPLVLDHGRVRFTVPALRGEPRLGQMVLLGLMGIAFVAILFARLPAGPGGNSGVGVPAPSNSASAPIATPAKTAKPTATSKAVSPKPARTLVPTEVDPSAKSSSTPSASPVGSSTPATYKVKRGDTLSSIADEFGTTWQVLAELNNISDPGRLRIGQVLQLP